jgi:hypothetical protein
MTVKNELARRAPLPKMRTLLGILSGFPLIEADLFVFKNQVFLKSKTNEVEQTMIRISLI